MIYTVALFKPDAVRRKLVGQIVSAIEARGLVLESMALAEFTRKQAATFYAEHDGRDYFAPLVEFMSSGPLYAVKLRAGTAIDVEAVILWRTLMGPSSKAKRTQGATIRGTWAMDCPEMENLVHGSDSVEAARRESDLLDSWGMLS